jgi:hypothetical protein
MVSKYGNKWVVRWYENKIRKYKSFDNEQEAIDYETEKRTVFPRRIRSER